MLSEKQWCSWNTKADNSPGQNEAVHNLPVSLGDHSGNVLFGEVVHNDRIVEVSLMAFDHRSLRSVFGAISTYH